MEFYMFHLATPKLSLKSPIWKRYTVVSSVFISFFVHLLRDTICLKLSSLASNNLLWLTTFITTTDPTHSQVLRGVLEHSLRQPALASHQHLSLKLLKFKAKRSTRLSAKSPSRKLEWLWLKALCLVHDFIIYLLWTVCDILMLTAAN